MEACQNLMVSAHRSTHLQLCVIASPLPVSLKEGFGTPPA
jgi:hypothetical protein